MKNFKIILGLFVMGFMVSCDIETPDKAADYYDVIIKKTNPLIQDYEQDLLDAFADYVPEEMEDSYNKLEDYVNKIDKELGEIEEFYGDASLITDAKSLVAAYKDALPLYKEKVEIESLSNAEYTNEMADKSAALMDEIDEILNEANDKFRATTKTFASDHKFNIKSTD